MTPAQKRILNEVAAVSPGHRRYDQRSERPLKALERLKLLTLKYHCFNTYGIWIATITPKGLEESKCF